MSYTWLKNYLGLPLTTEEYEDIPRPYAEFTLHVAFKTTMMGSLIGTVSGPSVSLAQSLYHHQTLPTLQDIKDRTDKYGTLGAKLGLAAGPLVCSYAWRSWVDKGDEIKVYDWCHRMRYNPRQMRMDRLVIIGAVAGCGTAMALNDSNTLGALVGATTGFATSIIANYVLKL